MRMHAARKSETQLQPHLNRALVVLGPGAPAEGTADLHYLGRYHDDFVRTDAGWQFGRREIEFW